MTAELRTWARALTVLAAAWVILKAGDAVAYMTRRGRDRRRIRNLRRARRDLHTTIVDAYATRRRLARSTPGLDAAIRAGEDLWLDLEQFEHQPTNKGDLTT